MTLPASEKSIQQIIGQQLVEKLELAYFAVDSDMKVQEASANLVDYGFPTLLSGQAIEEKIDFMIGMDPSTCLDLPVVSSPSGIPVRVNLLPSDDQLTVLITNASEATEQRQLLQQAANENELLVEKQKKLMAELKAASVLLEDKNEQLKEASRLQTSFLSGVSHEFRTPLTSIIGYTDLALNDLHKRATAEAVAGSDLNGDKYLAAVHRSSKHLLSLVENLLDHGKLDSGEIVIRPRETQLLELFQDVESVLSPLSDTKNIRLDFDLRCSDQACSEQDMVIIDDTRLRQCLINLIGNAVKFTDNGGVCVKASWCDEQLLVSIADSGLGISPEDLQKIRLPFYQAADTGKVGTGLGLTITERIVDMMGGHLEIHSELGEGTTVIFDMPAPVIKHVSRHQSELLDQQRSEMTENLRILLVEDDTDIADLVVMLLIEQGVEVEHVSNGALAIDCITKQSFDLVLMDIHMPIMTGYEAVAEFNRMGITTPVVVMSASAIDSDQERAKELGCAAYLVKPVDIQEVLNIAETLIV